MRPATLAWCVALAIAPSYHLATGANAAGPPAPPRLRARPAAARAAQAAPVPAPDAPAPGAPAALAPAARAPVVVERGLCGAHRRPDIDGHFIARADLTTAYVDGDDLLARVGRAANATLRPDYAPRDLVDLRTGQPSSPDRCEPPGGQCLRREAADALAVMLAAMRAAGFEGHIHSAFRAYAAQCGVFNKWAYIEGQGFCPAAEQSALAGHSQHQLGTTLDLFTRAWAAGGAVFRAGFGCTPAGRWLAEHGWEYGFVLPYPLHPDYQSPDDACRAREDVSVGIDPRTGYRAEPWHLRYIGRENAARFHADWLASRPGSGTEITLEQWLRRREGVPGDADLPVCDGCACGACSTLARSLETGGPCPAASVLRLDDAGRPLGADEAPRISEVRLARVGESEADVAGSTRANGARGADGAHGVSGAMRVVVEARVEVAAGTITQTPVMGRWGAAYGVGETFASLAATPRGRARRFDDLPGAWRLAVEPTGPALARDAWPVRAALTTERAAARYNGANVYLPAAAGARWHRVVVALPAGATGLRVALVRDGTSDGALDLPLPVP